MTTRDNSERENDSPVESLYTPVNGDEFCTEDDHSDDRDYRQYEGEPESVEDLGYFLEEVRTFNFLLRRTPCNVVREQMGEKCL